MTAGKSNGAAGRSGLPSVQGQGEITPKLLLRTLWHSLALATSVWGFQQLDYLEHLAEMDVSSQYGGHFQFLTICSLWATILTMCVALLQDLLEGLFGITRTSGTLGSVVGLVKTLMSVVTMPTETLVSILFWTLFAIDPTLLVPPIEREDPSNPGQTMKVPVEIDLSIDLAMHAAPALFLLVDYLFFSPPFSRAVRPIAVSTATTVAYCAWVEKCASVNGHFPYPVLDLLPDAARYGLYGLCAVIFVGVLQGVQTLHRTVDRTLLGGRHYADGDAGRAEVERVKEKTKATAKKAARRV